LLARLLAYWLSDSLSEITEISTLSRTIVSRRENSRRTRGLKLLSECSICSADGRFEKTLSAFQNDCQPRKSPSSGKFIDGIFEADMFSIGHPPLQIDILTEASGSRVPPTVFATRHVVSR